MKIQTKMLKKFISILCAATMVASGAVVSVGAAPKEKVAQDNRSNSELQEEIDLCNERLKNNTASEDARQIRAEIRQLREQITKHKKKQNELNKARNDLNKEIKKFKKWNEKHNSSKRLVDWIDNLVDWIGNIDCNSNAPFNASEIDKMTNEANNAIAKLQLHMSECEKQEKKEQQKQRIANTRKTYSQEARDNLKEEVKNKNKNQNKVSAEKKKKRHWEKAVDKENKQKQKEEKEAIERKATIEANMVKLDKEVKDLQKNGDPEVIKKMIQKFN